MYWWCIHITISSVCILTLSIFILFSLWCSSRQTFWKPFLSTFLLQYPCKWQEVSIIVVVVVKQQPSQTTTYYYHNSSTLIIMTIITYSLLPCCCCCCCTTTTITSVLSIYLYSFYSMTFVTTNIINSFLPLFCLFIHLSLFFLFHDVRHGECF